MSNLGMYQKITEASKKLGGPTNLLIAIAGLGYVAGKGTEIVIKKISSFLNGDTEQFKEYVINCYYKDDKGFELEKGEKIKLIGIDGDTAIIAKSNNNKEVHAMLLDKVIEISNLNV